MTAHRVIVGHVLEARARIAAAREGQYQRQAVTDAALPLWEGRLTCSCYERSPRMV